jgi:hypothetical protein
VIEAWNAWSQKSGARLGGETRDAAESVAGGAAAAAAAVLLDDDAAPDDARCPGVALKQRNAAGQ